MVTRYVENKGEYIMKRIEVCEVVKYYHLIEVDDEVDIEEIIKQANETLSKHDSGCDAIKAQLERLKNRYGFEYEIKHCYCGTEIEGLNVMDEVD